MMKPLTLWFAVPVNRIECVEPVPLTVGLFGVGALNTTFVADPGTLLLQFPGAFQDEVLPSQVVVVCAGAAAVKAIARASMETPPRNRSIDLRVFCAIQAPIVLNESDSLRN